MPTIKKTDNKKADNDDNTDNGGSKINGNGEVVNSSSEQSKTDSSKDENGNDGNNDNSGNDTPSVTVCTHSWQEITETVQSTRKVTRYKCAICYQKFNSLDAYYVHFDSSCGLSFNAYILRERYETVDEWESYDKIIITGYKCKHCGENKPAND